MLHCPVNKGFCLALCPMKCSFVSKWVTRANPFFSNALGFTSTWILVQPWSSKFSTCLFDGLLTKLLFLFFSQCIHPVFFKSKCLAVDCSPDIHCSKRFPRTILYTKMPVLWVCIFLEEKLSIPEHSFQQQSHLSKKLCYLPAQNLTQSKQSKTHFFERQKWDWKAERVIRKGKSVVQSRDQANINLDFVQFFSKNQDFY